MLTRTTARALLRRDLGGTWDVSANSGSLHNTRIGTRGTASVVLKLGQPVAALRRLAELGVTPAVRAWGELDGTPYTIQRMAMGFSPQPAWFEAHVDDLARLIRRYQRDERLAELLREDPSRDHLDVAAAASMFDDIQPRSGSPMWTRDVLVARTEWRRRAGELAPLPPAPIHADPHRWNYVVEGDRLYLVDWDQIDLSDRWRDAGLQLWWHVPEARWPEVVITLGQRLDGALRSRILWWAAFKAMRNGYWDDARGAEALTGMNARGFLAATNALVEI